MFAATLALAVVAAAPTNGIRDVFSTRDYPEAALRENRGGTASYRLLISDKGAPTGCEITHSSGWDDLDAATCSALVRRARFEPALDSEGRRAAGSYIGYMTWLVPGRASKGAFDAPMSELTITIAQGAKDIVFPATAFVALAVDPGGRLSDCTPTIRNSRSKALEADRAVRDELGAAACVETVRTLNFRPMTDATGRPIASIQTARVRFELAR